MDSSSSSSSSFIASGCSSPATLRRRNDRNASLHATTRSLPMSKRKAITCSESPTKRQPNRSISLQETHSGAALEGVEEVIDENEDAKSADSCNPPIITMTSNTNLMAALNTRPVFNVDCPVKMQQQQQSRKHWTPALELATLNEDWSTSSEDETSNRLDTTCGGGGEPATGLHKWISDSELYKCNTDKEADYKTLQLKVRNLKPGCDQPEDTHPLRRSKRQMRLTDEPALVVLPNYSEHEMEDWILRSSSEELLLQHFQQSKQRENDNLCGGYDCQENDDTISAFSNRDFDIDMDEDHLFPRELTSPECPTVLNLCQVCCNTCFYHD